MPFELPDPVVRFFPAPANGVGRQLNGFPVVVVEPVVPGGDSQQQEGFAEAVQLELGVDMVASSDFSARITRQMREFLFIRHGSTAGPVGGLERDRQPATVR